MRIGPLEIAVVAVERDGSAGQLAPALMRLQQQGVVRIVDLVLVARDATGGISATEIADLGEGADEGYRQIAGDLRGLLTEDDVANVALELPVDTSALVLLLEHVWALELEDASVRAGGRLLGQARISPLVVSELATELEAARAS